MSLLATHKDTPFHIGDIVRVHQKIQEDNKTRTQVFEGTVMAIQGSGMGKNFIVRRIGHNNVAIERIFPLASPLVEKIEVKTLGHVRRSKIYFIRDKSARELAEITRPKSAHHAVKTKSTKHKAKKSKSKKK